MMLMPKSKLKMPPLTERGKEPIGERIARLRKEKGFTQAELAEKMGTLRVLISDYERGKLRVHGEMMARFAVALGVTTDEIIGLTDEREKIGKISYSLLKRLKKIELLPSNQKKALIQTIDTFLKGAGLQ